MAKDNYFDNEDDIVTKKTVANSIKPVFSSLLSKINDQKELQAKQKRAEKDERLDTPSFPEDILELINADAYEITTDIAEKAEADVKANAEHMAQIRAKHEEEKAKSEKETK